MWNTAKRLKDSGILGINKRNADYISIYNNRKYYPLVDNKLKTKKIAQKSGLSVPELYGVIEYQHQIKNLNQILQDRSDFVVKPAQGSGGEGVLVISNPTKNGYRLVSGDIISSQDLAYHVSSIISGIFSLGGRPDFAMIEYRVKFDPIFEPIIYQGVPDIRIIVFLGVPVMAMVRLPTRMSDGKANLHQGAIGAGISIASGKTLSAVWKNQIINEHPDTGHTVADIEIPGWFNLLKLASSSFELTGLGLQGIDIVLDRELGPLILELNARPGLNIQIANRAGLLPRLQAVEKNTSLLKSVDERVNFAIKNF